MRLTGIKAAPNGETLWVFDTFHLGSISVQKWLVYLLQLVEVGLFIAAVDIIEVTLVAKSRVDVVLCIKTVNAPFLPLNS